MTENKTQDKNAIPLIDIQDLFHRFPDGTEALRGITMKIDHGSFTVIGGENGSGKTVLMKHLNGLLSPTSGRVLIDGISTVKDPWNARRKIGFVFQNSDTQIVAQSVRDDIGFGPRNIGLKKDEIESVVKKAAEAMDITHLLEHSPHRLSGGEKKKVAIAGILAMNPDIIVFDEPFAGLDYIGVKMLLRKMLDVYKTGTAVIVITHDLEKVLAHADRLVLINEGIIKGDGPPCDLLRTAAENGLRVPPGFDVKQMSWIAEELEDFKK